MFKLILYYIKKNKKAFTLGCMFAALEVIIELFIPLVMAEVVDVGVANKDIKYTLIMSGVMVVTALVSLSFGLLTAVFSSIAGQNIGANLREDMYKNIQKYSFENIEKFSTASLITRLTTDINTIQFSIIMAIRLLIRAPIMLISALILSIWINAKLALVFAVALPILVISIGLMLIKVRPLFLKMEERLDRFNLRIQENLIGIRTVKSFVREPYEKEKINESNLELKESAEKAFSIITLAMPIMQIVMFSTMIAIEWFGGKMIYAGTFKVGLLTSFITYVIQILMSLMMIAMIMMMTSRAISVFKRISEVINEVPTLKNGKAKIKVENGNIEFRNVGFKYNTANNEYNLKDINLNIKSGETIGIIGGTGSGKTTLVQLIPRLYDTTEGEVLVGGHNVKDYDMEELRNAVSMVLQKNTLFSGTILENLRWGNENATMEEIENATKLASIHDFIVELPKGYDTDLGQGGVNLSGGQKQRLCIARSILKNPKILILDDSTSAVDTATDAKIRKGLMSIMKDTTKIIIAQRVMSVENADKIIVLHDGKISAIGTHKELMKTSDMYKDVYNSQQEGVDFDA